MRMMLLICLLIISLIQGCDSDNDNNVEDVKLMAIRPLGDEIYLNDGITLFFSAKPSQVVVNDVILSEATAYNECGFAEISDKCYGVIIYINRFTSEPRDIAFVVT